ncbi:MAG: haloacid dehalogenase type II [Bosea sp. (in: a-proteobacteria)]|uniref:haloacid dehalogenase type II n=1 Tax=Bosea sp. (in: a-proteobacteria) TaxID=1871050 RepID=UPI002734D46A|nr:haloacid dehalogenase type II [Bosea sp. (in: a-proteobacteria)]MDP3257511.1 haloacid dehalogenase type II [Bosea sp. (in: a-proteobacteria)]MDP3319980.1 haloacid dehalogenase type II [Bosea sp. (in: a-proteobacteria)]
MTIWRPKFITFDCYGTLIYFEMGPAARRVYGSRLSPAQMDAFVEDFSSYRLDEVLGPWKPYPDVVRSAVARTCKLHGFAYDPADAQAIIDEIPTWGPHPDVPAGLAKVAKDIPLVILSNSMTDLIPHSVAKLGAPFHAAYTAQEAQAYKPRMQAFEYMFDQLGCGPQDVMHCSSSFRYDQMTAYDMKIAARVFVNRGHEPSNPYYSTHEIKDIGGLPALVGL